MTAPSFRSLLGLGCAWALVMSAVGFGCGSSEGPAGKTGDGGLESSCSNKVDDNGDGKVDCDDPTCASNPSCATESRKACSSQDVCVGGTGAISYRFTYEDTLPQCVSSFCEERDGVRLYFSVNTANISGSGAMGSLNTRFVSKTDVQGNAVTCDTLKQVSDAQENAGAAAWAGAIENSKRFNLLAFDVLKLSGLQAGNLVFNPLLQSATGKDFIIWTEVWYGDVDQSTKLPTGNRMAYGCFASGPAVDEIKLSDNAPGDGGVGRKIEVSL